jgi:hypothetical protein
MPIWAIVLIAIGSVLVGLMVLGAIVGPQDTIGSNKPSTPAEPSTKPAPTTKAPEPTKPPPSPTPTKTSEGGEASPTPTVDMDKVREAAGLPPSPKPEVRQAYLNALNAIDPRIIKPGKEDQAVSRGINQCSSIKSSPDDREKLVQSTLERFTITTRFPEIATPETGGKILDAVHKHICPDF